MRITDFIKTLGADFYTGVPDSLLKALCNYLMTKYGIDPEHHIIAANEGNAAAIAAGYHLATGKIPVVYMQNSGEGNIINPLASLLNDKVYGIPVMFVIGWRGEPGVHDEPQHIYQGEVTKKLLDVMDVASIVVDVDTTREEIEAFIKKEKNNLKAGKSIAFIIRKNALEYDGDIKYSNDNTLLRENIIQCITEYSGNDPIISTTGKTSRELFEIRVARGEDHSRDFLTVGSMGHSSSIALGAAIQIPQQKIWCIDGDGAALMHMGSMGVIGAFAPANLIHILINNGSHESVGGAPTVAAGMDWVSIAKACGYKDVYTVDTIEKLRTVLAKAKENDMLTFIEVKSAIGAREDLGRPTTTARANKEAFMEHMETL